MSCPSKISRPTCNYFVHVEESFVQQYQAQFGEMSVCNPTLTHLHPNTWLYLLLGQPVLLHGVLQWYMNPLLFWEQDRPRFVRAPCTAHFCDSSLCSKQKEIAYILYIYISISPWGDQQKRAGRGDFYFIRRGSGGGEKLGNGNLGR